MAGGQLKSLIGTIRKKPSKAPDRRSDAEVNGAAGEPKTTVMHDIAHLGLKNAKTMAEALPTLASGDPINDKELMLEHGVSMLQGLPLNSGLSDAVSKAFIKMLWHDLPHPAATVAGPAARYRAHDGSGNNPWNPEMGKAGTAYCRNVPPMRPKGQNLPDPELVYEQLLRRNGPFREHPSGLNRLFFSFATVVIHECFQTSRKDQWINETSSYVDLSTLYGNTEVEQERVRTHENGTIFPDSIASERIMMMPPGVVALLVLFSRNHNAIAADMFSINEQGKYKPWDSLDADGKKWQDNDIFQVARNINVGFFATIVLHDYVAAILNTPRADSTWSLDLGGEIKSAGNRVERGTGNVVSVEFAVLYHWHAALSAADDKWMEYNIRQVFPDKPLDDLTVEDFGKIVMTAGHMLMAQPAKEWTFAGLKRGANGAFDNAELAEIIKGAIEEPAHAFGAHGTPNSLRLVDILGMMQARDVFNVCTLNEFRNYLNLTEYKTFEDWNPDKEVARAAELLYGHIDNLELYPGLMAEVTKPAMPGSGVCPGQTTGRGILDDAVSLVRGDRYLSYDFNSNTLSNWGVGKIGNLPPGSYGGMLPQLLFNAVPGGFPGTSAYALLPFYTPKAAQGILRGNKAIQKYELARPPSNIHVAGIYTQEACAKAFADRDTFAVNYLKPYRVQDNGQDFELGWDEQKKSENLTKTLHGAFFDSDFQAKTVQFFSETVSRLIKNSALKYSSSKRSVDIVRDVTNIAPILWVADRFALPLKTQKQPRGLLSIPQTFDMLLSLFEYRSFNILPVNEWKLRDAAEKTTPTLRKIIQTHLQTQSGFKESIVDWMTKGSAYEVGPEADKMYHALIKSGLPLQDVIDTASGLAACVAGNLSQQASVLIDLFLRPEYETYKTRIIELAHKDDAASLAELEGFALEGMRHVEVVPGIPRKATRDVTVSDGTNGVVNIKAGQTVLLATSKAAMDPTAFPDPDKLIPDRPRSAYTLLGYGLNFEAGTNMLASALAVTLKEVFKLKNLRRAPGKQGVFTMTTHQIAGVDVRAYLDSTSKENAIPTTLTLWYDE